MRRHDARELLVGPLRFEGKPLEVEAEQKQNRCVQVADMDRTLGRIETEIVSCPVLVAAFSNVLNSCYSSLRAS